MRLVLLGPPAVGKGTQGARIGLRYKIPHISTGDIFRHHIREKTALGIEAQRFISAGQLVPDWLTVDVLRQRLMQSDCTNGWLLDGYPRTVMQAETLDSFDPPDAVINLTADENALIERVSGRRICRSCAKTYHVSYYNSSKCECGGELIIRDDDNQTAFRNRLKAYSRQTEPLTEYYQNQGKLLSVNGTADIETVFDEARAALTAKGY